MNQLRRVIFAGILLLSLCAGTAQAEWLFVTNCEMVTIEGHEYGKLTFDIRNNATGPNWGQLRDLILFPYPGNTPLIPLVDVTLPAGWEVGPGGALHYWRATSPEFYVYPGQTLSGIQIVLPQPQVCYEFSPAFVLLDGTPTYPVCFACPGVTPSDGATWGRIKTQYR